MKRFLLLTLLTVGIKPSNAQFYSFSFKYEGPVDEINTYNKTFTRRYSDATLVIHFGLSEIDQKAILEYANKMKLHKIRTPLKTKECNDIVVPSMTFLLEFTGEINNKKETVFLEWTDKDCRHRDKAVKRIEAFIAYFYKFLLTKSEFKDLKESDIVFL